MTSVTSNPIRVEDENQFSALSSPVESEGKSSEGKTRFSKDDIKEQAFLAKENIKSRVTDLKEQVLKSDVVNKAINVVKEKTGISKEASTDEVVDELQGQAEQQWETVKRKGNKQLQKAQKAVNEELDARLTPDQKQKLDKTAKVAKVKAIKAEKQAQSWSRQLVISLLSAPQLRGLKSFILRNNLSLPFVVGSLMLTLWVGLTFIRLMTWMTTPSVPEFDIHSKEASVNWLKYHAGELRDKASEMQDSLSGRAAALLANYDWDRLKLSANDYRDIGMRKLGLAEPTWGEYIWARLTGKPVTWQDRVENIMSLAKQGINRADIVQASGGFFNKVKDFLRPHEPTLSERAYGYADSIKNRIPGMESEGLVDGWKSSIQDGFDSIRSHLPGSPLEGARQRVYEATHPSTLDNIKSTANYIKNRVIHGTQEAVHSAQDSSNRAMDEARYKMGL